MCHMCTRVTYPTETHVILASCAHHRHTAQYMYHRYPAHTHTLTMYTTHVTFIHTQHPTHTQHTAHAHCTPVTYPVIYIPHERTPGEGPGMFKQTSVSVTILEAPSGCVRPSERTAPARVLRPSLPVCRGTEFWDFSSEGSRAAVLSTLQPHFPKGPGPTPSH